MNRKPDSASTGLERFNALLAWWGTPNGNGLANTEAQAKRVQALTTDLSDAFNEASRRQLETLFATNERVARSLQDLLRVRQPQDLMAAQSSIVTGLLEGLAAQTKLWAELTQKVHGSCSAAVTDAAEDVREQAVRAVDAAPPATAERSAGKRAAQA